MCMLMDSLLCLLHLKHLLCQAHCGIGLWPHLAICSPTYNSICIEGVQMCMLMDSLLCILHLKHLLCQAHCGIGL